jgi:hypothetical protein
MVAPFDQPPPLTAALDHRPSRYFHGRKEILSTFSELAARATLSKSGTTFLIQGAPGAGKTALLAECERLVQESDWETAAISSAALWDPNELQQSLKLRRTWKVGGGAARVGISGIGGAEINAERSPQTVMNLLRGGKRPLLLSLDEAQILGKEELIPSDRLHTVVNILNSIHNGGLDHPVILLAAGLGTTLWAFGRLGISRFAMKCLVELGALGKEAERAVLNDWLTKEGGAKGDPTGWIDAIARETHGWPQHIQSYANIASDQLKANDGIMTPEGLHAVLEAGRADRGVYYKQRLVDFRADQIRSLARSIADVPRGEPAEYRDIVSSLAQEYGEDGAETLFKRMEQEGLLAQSGMGYAVPIPSMHSWLKDEYVRESIEIPRGKQLGHARPPPGRQHSDRGIEC